MSVKILFHSFTDYFVLILPITYITYDISKIGFITFGVKCTVFLAIGVVKSLYEKL